MEQEQKQERSNLVVINEEILADKRLTPAEKMVYARIAYFKQFWEKSSTTAEYLGLKESAVKIAKRTLENLRYIFCVKNTGHGKRYVADINLGIISDEKIQKECQEQAQKKDEYWAQYEKAKLQRAESRKAKKQENSHQTLEILTPDVKNPNTRCEDNSHQMLKILTSDVKNPNIRCEDSSHIDKNIVESGDKSLDKTLDKSGKHNIVSNDTKAKPQYGDAKINRAFEVWEEVMGKPLNVDTENRKAARWLMSKSKGEQWIRDKLELLKRARTYDAFRYSKVKIYDFKSLFYQVNALEGFMDEQDALNGNNNTQAIAERVEMTPEIEDMFDFWKQVMRVSCPRDNENVKACKELLEDAGEDGTKRLIMGLMFRGKHGYLPATVTNIVDFVGLNRNKVAMQTFCDKHWDYWQQLMKAASTGKNIWEVY